MSTTPSYWLPLPILPGLPASSSSNMRVTGLSNGNVLVAWTEFSNTVAPDTGAETVGIIYDARGNAVSDLLLLNSGTYAGAATTPEYYPEFAATDDGGFVMVFQTISATGNGIRSATYDAQGNFESSANVATATVIPDVDFYDPHVVARNDGSFLITYEQRNVTSFDQSILGRILDASGNLGSVITVEADSNPATLDGDLRNPVSATLTNGVVVTVFEEPSDALRPLKMSSVNPDGSTGFDNFKASFSGGGTMTEPDIAALTGGGFVVVYTLGGGDIEAVVWDSNGVSDITVDIASTADGENEPTVIGLPDGGFYVAWDHDGAGDTMEGQRYDASGIAVGNLFDFGVPGSDLELSLTADGRIVFSYYNASTGDYEVEYLDPRDDNFTLETGGTEATTRLEGGIVFGSAGSDTIYGQGGRDTIYGLNGEDTLYGGGNRDYLGGSAGNDTMYGGQGNDVFVVGSVGDTIVEFSGQGNDTVRSTISYRLDIQLEDLNLVGNSNISGFGNNKDNLLQGNGGNNVLRGFKGDDVIKGFNGRDGMIGDNGADVLFGMQGNDVLRGDLGADLLFGGAGSDRFVFRALSDSKVNVSQRDIIKDFTRGSDKIDLRQLDASDTLAGDQSFQFIGAAGFNGNGDFGQVRFNANSAGVMVAVDINADGQGDMLILVEGVSSLSANDFLL